MVMDEYMNNGQKLPRFKDYNTNDVLQQLTMKFFRDHTLIIFGNYKCWETRKTFVPTPQVGQYLRMFRERRIDCVVQDEARTSKLCSREIFQLFKDN